jgi:hypothetical protein
LGNKSIIIAKTSGVKDTFNKFAEHFPIFLIETTEELDAIIEKQSITHLYVSKYGTNDRFISSKCKNIIHCIFATTEPHGEYYLPVGNTINNLFNTNYPVLPHIVMPPLSDCGSMRSELGIPENAIVFGRYGGLETFDIPPVYDIIKLILQRRNDIYFLFMNTNRFANHPRIIHLPGNYCMKNKQKFINTCDAMLHARSRGETFGLACAEFDVNNKPIFTYELSPENEHLLILGNRVKTYKNDSELYNLLNGFVKQDYTEHFAKCSIGYARYTPEYVMNIFNKYDLSLCHCYFISCSN